MPGFPTDSKVWLYPISHTIPHK